ncbi:MAG: type II toxin-antitoxin system RelE/ParE family toxin [Candidatus Hydrogenedentes bacterium]|nr:type II toxin-antitoxin system RelE/ParE family toxin [Candidatus Hydrogenedentota bacterium]
MKELSFEFDTRKRLKAFPYDVRREVAHALYEAQRGGKHEKVKVLTGFHGAGVLEIRDRYEGCAYRVFYTTLIPSRICILHAVKKKSKRGISTPKQELDLLRQRLIATREKYGG